MRGMGRLLAAAIAVAMTWAAASAPSVQAAGFAGGVFVGFSNSDARGLVLVDRIRADSARVTTALGKLMPGHRYRLIFSTDGCATPLADAELITRVRVRADADGGAFTTSLVGTSGGVWKEARSARLMEEEGIFYFCRAVTLLDQPGPEPDGAWARFRGDVRGLLGLHVDTSPIELSVMGLRPDARYRLVHSPLACKEFTEGDPDQPIVIGRFMTNAAGQAHGVTETVSINDTLTVGSVRVERRSTGAVWACANLHPFSVVVV